MLHLYCSVYSRYYAKTARKANTPETFLGNGSVNTLAQQQKRCVVHVARAVLSQFCTGVCEERT
jgi:hypothetical protein